MNGKTKNFRSNELLARGIISSQHVKREGVIKQGGNMSNMLRKSVLVVAGVALVQFSAVATAQEKSADAKTTAVKAGANMAKSLAGPLTMTREQRLAAKPVDAKAATGMQKKAPEMSAEDKAILAAAQPEMSAGGAPNSSADDEARRDFSEEWKAMDQQDR